MLCLQGPWPKHSWYFVTKIKGCELDSDAVGWLPRQFSHSLRRVKAKLQSVYKLHPGGLSPALAAPTVSCGDLDKDLENQLSQFSKDMKSGDLVNPLDSRIKIQSDAGEPGKKFPSRRNLITMGAKLDTEIYMYNFRCRGWDKRAYKKDMWC